MCKAENKCSDLGRVSPRMLAYLIRLVSPLSSSSLRNLLFDFFSRGGLPVCARCRRKVDVPGEYLTGLNWNEAKKRNEGTIILRERKGRARGERERERGNTHRLARRRCIPSWHSHAFSTSWRLHRSGPAEELAFRRNSKLCPPLPSTATRSAPSPPYSREKDLLRGFGSWGGGTIKPDIEGEKKWGRERKQLGYRLTRTPTNLHLSARSISRDHRYLPDFSDAFALVFHRYACIGKLERKAKNRKKMDW